MGVSWSAVAYTQHSPSVCALCFVHKPGVFRPHERTAAVALLCPLARQIDLRHQAFQCHISMPPKRTATLRAFAGAGDFGKACFWGRVCVYVKVPGAPQPSRPQSSNRGELATNVVSATYAAEDAGIHRLVAYWTWVGWVVRRCAPAWCGIETKRLAGSRRLSDAAHGKPMVYPNGTYTVQLARQTRHVLSFFFSLVGCFAKNIASSVVKTTFFAVRVQLHAHDGATNI